jgi:outer membrane protein assembly factor BamD (BamD/ComL family)
MSVLGIAASSLFSYLTQGPSSANNNGQNNKAQQFQQEFKQLGQDLQSGNLSAAQSDLATLQQNRPQINSTAAMHSNTPIVTAFNQLSSDLQSGNLTAAQQDYATIQQDFQNQSAQRQSTQGHHHHHHGGSGSNSSSSAPINQLLSELGSALQIGNISNAQQAYSSLQQNLLQFTQNSGLPVGTGTNSSNTSILSVNA